MMFLKRNSGKRSRKAIRFFRMLSISTRRLIRFLRVSIRLRVRL
ncbi:hypothetical protein EVA_06574 [gut metagenome]|uniref:Uncharacterized protein n=1 Tax=gut metagenome TaxID=749906 RepID=J9CYI3_9ZZZZ